MSQTASRWNSTAMESGLFVAFELGWTRWRLAFGFGMGQKDWQITIPARNVAALTEAIRRARQRLGLPCHCPVFSCYEAGREGFWLDRLLKQMGVENLVVDSSSIEVNRRARRAKTDRLDAEKLLSMLLRHHAGEKKLWSVVHVPTPEQEDGRHLQRQIRTLKKEQTRSINRIRGLLAGQGVAVKANRRGLLESLDSIRIWDGSPLPEGLRLRVESEVARHGFLHRQLLELEARRNARIRQAPDRAAEIARRLMTLRGIAEVGAETYGRELSWRGFRNRRQVGSLIGLTSTPHQSGDSSHERGISRAGNRHVRGIAIDLAWLWLRQQPHSELTLWFNRRFANGGPRLRKIGIVAVARKLLIALWRYADFGEIPKGALLKTDAA
ncbi:MAG: IS110 family transposase [bacterium]